MHYLQDGYRVDEQGRQWEDLQIVSLQNIIDPLPDSRGAVCLSLVFLMDFDHFVNAEFHFVEDVIVVFRFIPKAHPLIEIIEIVVELVKDQEHSANQVVVP